MSARTNSKCAKESRVNRLSLTILLLIISAAIIYGQSQSRKSGRNLEQQLVQLENEWLMADARQDTPAIKQLIATDWTPRVTARSLIELSC
jgi:hypothetical protein